MRVAYLFPKQNGSLPIQAQETLYSFTAKSLPIQKALEAFATAYDLNILVDKDVSGEINIDFKKLGFDQAMTALLGSLGYYWELNDDLIRVRSWQTRLFNLDYIRLNRVGSSTSEAQVSSGSASSSSGGGGDSGGSGSNSDTQAGRISIEQENRVEFWDELEKQLKTLVSEEGRLVINNISGTVQISDRHPESRSGCSVH